MLRAAHVLWGAGDDDWHSFAATAWPEGDLLGYLSPHIRVVGSYSCEILFRNDEAYSRFHMAIAVVERG